MATANFLVFMLICVCVIVTILTDSHRVAFQVRWDCSPNSASTSFPSSKIPAMLCKRRICEVFWNLACRTIHSSVCRLERVFKIGHTTLVFPVAPALCENRPNRIASFCDDIVIVFRSRAFACIGFGHGGLLFSTIRVPNFLTHHDSSKISTLSLLGRRKIEHKLSGHSLCNTCRNLD